MRRIAIKLSGRIFGIKNASALPDYASLLNRISKDCQPVVVAGGGSIARHYIASARASGAAESALDEIGIEISRLNAKLLICAIGSKAYPHPPTSLQEAIHAADSGLIVIAGGLYPGQSTNGTAALIAESVGASEFLNATDVDGVYDKDPNKFKEAKRLDSIPIEDLKKMLMQEESVAGGYDLMDIVALKVIERSKIKTRILSVDIQAIEGAIKDDRAGTRITFPA